MSAPAQLTRKQKQVAAAAAGVVGLGATAYGVYEYVTSPSSLGENQETALVPHLLNAVVKYCRADGCLYIVDIFDQVIWKQKIDDEGEAVDTMEKVLQLAGEENPTGCGWRRDGAMLVLLGGSKRLVKVEPGADPDAEPEVVADLSQIESAPAYDMVLDGEGGVYVNGWGCQPETYFTDPGSVKSGQVIHLPPDYDPAQSQPTQYGDLKFPCGSVVTPDGRTLITTCTFLSALIAWDRDPATGALTNQRIWARLPGVWVAGICLDAEGCAWVGIPSIIGPLNCLMGPLSFYARKYMMGTGFGAVARVQEGGKVLESRILNKIGCMSLCLGGPDGCTLFLACTALTLWTAKMYVQAGNSFVATMRVKVPAASSPSNPNYNGGSC